MFSSTVNPISNKDFFTSALASMQDAMWSLHKDVLLFFVVLLDSLSRMVG
jgi:hypothetical protein